MLLSMGSVHARCGQGVGEGMASFVFKGKAAFFEPIPSFSKGGARVG